MNVRLKKRQSLGLCYRCDQPLSAKSLQSCEFHLLQLRKYHRDFSRKKYGHRAHDPLAPQYGYKDAIHIGLQKRPNPSNGRLTGIVKVFIDKQDRSECLDCFGLRTPGSNRCAEHLAKWKARRAAYQRHYYQSQDKETRESRLSKLRIRYRRMVERKRIRIIPIRPYCPKCKGRCEIHDDYAKCLNCGKYIYPEAVNS